MNDPFKKYRRNFRAWKNSLRLKREWRHYHRLFQSRGLMVPDDETIRQTIESKYPHLQPKPRGKLNILAIYHHYNWENQSLKPSLEKFGFVRHYDWFEEYNHQAKDWFQSVKAKMNEDLIRRVRQWIKEDGTDVIFTYLSGHIVYPETIRKIRALGGPLFNLALNDKEAFVGKMKKGLAMGARDICRYFDLCWTSTRDALEKYCVEGALPLYIPEGANPEIHRPYNMEKSIDVSFVGQCYGNRSEIIQNLKDCGIQVEAYGYGWPNRPLSTEDMVRLYSNSKINLGFGGVSGHKDTFCLKGRDFEIPMSGGLYLTEYHPELEGCYELGRAIVTYTNFDDLLEKIRYFLSNAEEADAIRKRGRERALNGHTWEMRFEKIFKLLSLI
jgi:spore maturation protein CgeB